MVPLTVLLGAAAALASLTASALNLPQRRDKSRFTVIETSAGNISFHNQEYCRVSQQNAQGWSHAGPLNMSIYKFPSSYFEGNTNRTLLERIATNIGQNDTVYWVVDVPVNITYELVYEQHGSMLSQFMTTVPPTDNTDCDQSLLKLPFSAASLSNATGLIGTPEFTSATTASYGYSGALALMAAGVAALL